MKKVFDENYKDKFAAAGLLKKTNGELSHFLSDVATMHVVRWSDGGWGMCSHNYDGDVLTDEIAQVRIEIGAEGGAMPISIVISVSICVCVFVCVCRFTDLQASSHQC